MNKNVHWKTLTTTGIQKKAFAQLVTIFSCVLIFLGLVHVLECGYTILIHEITRSRWRPSILAVCCVPILFSFMLHVLEIFLRELILLGTLIPNPKSSRSVHSQFSPKLAAILWSLISRQFSLLYIQTTRMNEDARLHNSKWLIPVN